MDIYTNQICFVYKWTQLSTSKWYIGSHYSKTAHPNDGYICSSKIVKPMILKNPSDWIRIILEIGLAKDMIKLEHRILTCLDAAKTEYSYNEHNGGKKFYRIGPHSTKSKNKMSKNRIGKIHKSRGPATDATKLKLSIAGKIRTDEQRLKMSEKRKLRITLDITKIKMSIIRKDKPQQIVTCPHCNKTGGITNMKRYHFNNCKFKINV